MVNGSVAQTRWGPVQVQVRISSGKISDVTVLQQPNGNWGLVKAVPGSPFALKPGSPQWGQGHHNATVKVGPLHGGPADVGAVTPTGPKLAVLR